MLTSDRNQNIGMHRFFYAIRCGLLAAGSLFTASAAHAVDVTVCNKFNHPVFFAFAWEQDGRWTSRGWSEVKSGDCRNNPFDLSKLNLDSFFFRGETNWIPSGGGKKTMHQWGKGREFTVQDKTFVFRDADRNRGDGRFVAFSPSLKGEGGPSQLTITIQEDGVNTSQSIKRVGAAPSAPPPPKN